jgi:outer membrane lipoprotein
LRERSGLEEEGSDAGSNRRGARMAAKGRDGKEARRQMRRFELEMKGKKSRLPVLFLSLLSIFPGLAGGCAHPISWDLMNSARKDLTYPVVIQNPKKYMGSLVIWGGIISDLRNNQGGAKITVLETPLDRREVPQTRVSRGVFIARGDEYLDPRVYQKGKKVTLAGELAGEETKSLDDMEYVYPVIHILELHLWKGGPFKSLEKFERQEYQRRRNLDIPPLWINAEPEEREDPFW